MKELSESEAKILELGILEAFHNYCLKNDLSYSLAGGTLIGALRHKGFIPWDDDVDVFMPRKDYEKFVNNYRDNRYKVVKAEDNSQWAYVFARLTDTSTKVVLTKSSNIQYNSGLWLDIFPIDNCPDTNEEINKMKKQVNFIHCIYNLRLRNYWEPSNSAIRNVLFFIVHSFLSIIPLRCYRKKLNDCIQKYNNKNTKYCSFWTLPWYKVVYFPKSAFTSLVDVSFEGKKFKAMQGYDEYLTGCFGEYMTPPPIEMQVPEHGIKAYKL